jgi:hypothetical protein
MRRQPKSKAGVWLLLAAVVLAGVLALAMSGQSSPTPPAAGTPVCKPGYV